MQHIGVCFVKGNEKCVLFFDYFAPNLVLTDLLK